MQYYFSKRASGAFEEIVSRVIDALAKEGFGVLTRIDVQETLKKKIGVNFRRYMILGACNPPFAHRALEAEPKIGLMLPCNLVVDEVEPGKVEVAAIDPVASMMAVENRELEPIAKEIREKLLRVIDSF